MTHCHTAASMRRLGDGEVARAEGRDKGKGRFNGIGNNLLHDVKSTKNQLESFLKMLSQQYFLCANLSNCPNGLLSLLKLFEV